MNLADPHFAEPRWLWLALLGPLVLVLLQRYAALARRRQLARLAAPEFVRELTRSHSHLRRGLKNGFLVLAVAGMGFAMARPQWGQQSEKSHAVGHDVVFILDCSRSMLATDVLPNRLQRAKLAILDCFFAGGSNSLRAWRPRRLGRGSTPPPYSTDPKADGLFDYSIEKPAEILLEGSIELRQKLFGFVSGAIFVDAGNVWNFRPLNVKGTDGEIIQDKT